MQPKRRLLGVWAFTLAVVLGLSGCTRTGEINSTDPQWVPSEPATRAKIAVVFAHGIFGDTLGTWQSDKNKSFFGYLKEAPGVGDKLDTFAFGFTSTMLKGSAGGSLDIREAANKMHETLRYYKVLDYDAIVFVAHSMGGLVVLRELINHPELKAKVPLIALYATPQEGAEIARIGDMFITNSALRQMVPADGNGFLQQLSDDWARLNPKPNVVCAYEKAPTFDTTIVVNWSSSTRFCTEPGQAIGGSTHLSIVKPDRPTHDSVVLLVNALNQHVIGKMFGAKLETPDFVTEGDHLLYRVRSVSNNARLVNIGRGRLTLTVTELSDEKLFVTPREMPVEIPGEQTRPLGVHLLLGATANKYEFFLKTNEPAQRRVIVEITDLNALKEEGVILRDKVTTRFSAILSDPKNASFADLKPGDEKALGELSAAAFDVIKKEFPDADPLATWLLTANVLAGSNWPQISAAALRRAEANTRNIAAWPPAQSFAGQLAGQLGTKQIFVNAPTPEVKELPILAQTPYWTSKDQIANAEALAGLMKKFPTFRPYGLSLEGDILTARGDKQGAFRAYRESATLQDTPSLAWRVKTLDKGGLTPEGGAIEKLPGQANKFVLPDPRVERDRGTFNKSLGERR
jgi:pimeloyl-ACP methyl ester carboxylesterase